MKAVLRFLSHAKRIIILSSFSTVLSFSFLIQQQAAYAACTALPTDRGTVTQTVNVPAAGTYYVWSRIQSAVSTNNTFLMQIGTTICNVNIGGASLTPNTWTWVNYQNGATSTRLTETLAAGSNVITMAGNADGVEVDRVILTQDSTCTPTGTGDACANPADTTPPTVAITAPANNTTISTTTAVTATATDDVAVAKVEFYVDGTLAATDTASPYTYSLVPSSYATGAHTLTAKAYDTSNNTTTSGVINFTIPGVTYKTGDINKDGSVNLQDFSLLAADFGHTGSAIKTARADINGDGTVNLQDFSLLATNFGK